MRIATTTPALGMLVAAAILGGELVGVVAYRHARTVRCDATLAEIDRKIDEQSDVSIRLRDLERKVEQLEQRLIIDRARVQVLVDELLERHY